MVILYNLFGSKPETVVEIDSSSKLGPTSLKEINVEWFVGTWGNNPRAHGAPYPRLPPVPYGNHCPPALFLLETSGVDPVVKVQPVGAHLPQIWLCVFVGAIYGVWALTLKLKNRTIRGRIVKKKWIISYS